MSLRTPPADPFGKFYTVVRALRNKAERVYDVNSAKHHQVECVGRHIRHTLAGAEERCLFLSDWTAPYWHPISMTEKGDVFVDYSEVFTAVPTPEKDFMAAALCYNKESRYNVLTDLIEFKSNAINHSNVSAPLFVKKPSI